MRRLLLTAVLAVLSAGAGTADAQWRGRSFGGTSYGGTSYGGTSYGGMSFGSRSFGSRSFDSSYPGGYYSGYAVPYYPVPYYAVPYSRGNVGPGSGSQPSVVSGNPALPAVQPDAGFGWLFWR